MGDRRGAYRVLVWKPGGKIQLGRPRIIWECNIKIDLQEVDGEAWNGLICLRIRTVGGSFVNAVMNIRISLNARKFLTS